MFVFPIVSMGQAGKPVLTPQPPASTSPAPVPTVSSDGMAASPNYVIGPEDSVHVDVWNQPSVTTTLPVRPDGKISLALVGDMQAAGLTPMQLSAEITKRLKQYITDPVVNVSVLSVNSKHIYLVGEVMRVGPLPLTPGMTVLQALATAGGLTPYANKKHIYILRGDPNKPQKIPFDYKKALKGDMQGVSLVAGDTIVAQ